MEFCPKCDKMLVSKKGIVCCTCGYTKKMQTRTKEEITYKHEKVKASDQQGNMLAVHKHKCPYCGYDKAEVMSYSSWWADESEVTKFKCGKCGKVVHLEGEKIT